MRNLIYIIDDDEEICEILKIAFEARDYEVKYALDGHLGLKLLQKKPPDMLILDLQMPKMNGYEIIHKMRLYPKLKKVPILVLTVITKGSRKTDEEWKNSLEVDDFITKPFDPLDIISRVDKIVRPSGT